jgi:exodeoxyribonuclease V alpha subunit
VTDVDAGAAVEAVRGLLQPAGAPVAIAVATVTALGDDAAEQLSSDPWRVLAVPGVPPAAADALARSVDPRWRLDDVRRGAALVRWLLTRAANDGHTVVRQSVVMSALQGYDVASATAAIAAAIDGGDVVGFDSGDLALTRWATAEDDAALAVARLAPSGVSAIVGPRGQRRDDAVEAAAREDADTVVLEADDVVLEDAAAALAALSAGTSVVLAGDPDRLPPPGAGCFFRDVVSSGAVPVTHVDDEDSDLGRLAGAVRRGRLPVVDSPDREVVVVPARDAADAVRRTIQLVSDSIPRVLGISATDIQVLTPRLRGSAGARALSRVLEEGAANGVAALPVSRTAGRRWPAVVLVLPGEAAGALSRALVYTAITCAERHLSVVHAAGPALAVAVAAPPRVARTRLGSLLAAALDDQGRSSVSASAGSTSIR